MGPRVDPGPGQRGLVPTEKRNVQTSYTCASQLKE